MQTLDDTDILKLWNALPAQERDLAMVTGALNNGVDDFFDLTPDQRRQVRKEAVGQC